MQEVFSRSSTARLRGMARRILGRKQKTHSSGKNTTLLLLQAQAFLATMFSPAMQQLTRNALRTSKVLPNCRWQSTGATKKFILEYFYVDNMLERRAPVRPAHFEYLKSFLASKTLIAGGACVPDVKTGILILQAESEQTVQDFAKGDPYVISGLVTRYTIREWNIVAGGVV